MNHVSSSRYVKKFKQIRWKNKGLQITSGSDSSESKCCSDFFPAAAENAARNFEFTEPMEEAPERQKRPNKIVQKNGGKGQLVDLNF